MVHLMHFLEKSLERKLKVKNNLKERRLKEVNNINENVIRIGGIRAVYKIFAKYYFKSFFPAFFNFVFPVLIFAILGTIMNVNYMLPGVIAMTTMSQGLTAMPFSILELKKSVLLKRIGASPIKSSKFTIVVLTWFSFMIMLSIIWLMLWAIALHPGSINSMFSNLSHNHWLSFIGFLFGNILNIVTCLSVGLVIASISKGENQAQAIGMLLFFPSSFLTGQFVTIDVISQVEVMNWISRFIPFRYTTMMIISSWSGNNIFEFSDIVAPIMLSGDAIADLVKVKLLANETIDPHTLLSNKTLYTSAEVILGFVIPPIVSFGSIFLSIKKFSWSAMR